MIGVAELYLLGVVIAFGMKLPSHFSRTHRHPWGEFFVTVVLESFLSWLSVGTVIGYAINDIHNLKVFYEEKSKA